MALRQLGKTFALCLLLFTLATSSSRVYAQLRVVSYNTATGSTSTPRTGLDTVLEAIGDEIVNGFSKPIDVLALQEQESWSTTTFNIVSDLNAIYGAGTYNYALLNGITAGAGRPGLIYNTNTVSLISRVAFGSVSGTEQARQTSRYQLRPVGYDSSADFYVYSNHYKSGTSTSDKNRRDHEATVLRADLDGLGQGTSAILAGDYNIQSSFENSYQTLLAAGNGQAFDPISTPGTWNNNSSLRITHTQSPATSSAFPGQVLGGVDDRFDFQLVTGELLDNEGLSYINNSYRAFGNNGSHSCCGSPITSGNGASPTVLNALTTASDHLPVVADYQVPAIMMASLGSIPSSVPMGASVNVDVLVENIANALIPSGADELDYTISVSGALSGGLSSFDNALGGGNTHQIGLDTSTLGAQSGTITVTTSSQSAMNTVFNLPVNFTVGSGGGPVFGVIAKDDFDSTLNRNSFSQTPTAGTFSSPADGFETFQVGVSSTIPFALLDDSAVAFPADTHGLVDSNVKTDAWFGVVDINNAQNPSGTGTATWEFDISTATSGLEVSIDMAAMGDFDALADVFDWTYSIDGGASSPLFTSSVDSSGSATYTLADGDQFTLDDPLEMTTTDAQTIELSNLFQTLTSSLVGTGNTLTLEFNAITDDDSGSTSRSYAFDNIIVEGFSGGSFLEADFNEDGFVDALDLAQWEGDYGINDESDANGDGLSNGLDFLVWQEQFGQFPPPLSAVASVPEPNAILLVLGVLPWIGTRTLRFR